MSTQLFTLISKFNRIVAGLCFCIEHSALPIGLAVDVIQNEIVKNIESPTCECVPNFTSADGKVPNKSYDVPDPPEPPNPQNN
eukprot:4449834-Amphidinium_carterae.1